MITIDIQLAPNLLQRFRDNYLMSFEPKNLTETFIRFLIYIGDAEANLLCFRLKKITNQNIFDLLVSHCNWIERTHPIFISKPLF